MAAALTLGGHALLLLWLLQEDRRAPRVLPPEQKLVIVRIHLPPPAPQTLAVEILENSSAPRRETPVTPAPPTAIAPDPVEETPSEQPIEEETTPRVDWYGEAANLVARAAGESVARETLGPPLQKMRKPCTPRDSSFDWSPEVKKYGLLPLPYVIIADRCLITVGFVSCVFGPLPEPNQTLFDDMQEGKTPLSSVPDPNHCD
ncbi:MAG TPA: hypothetical protein VMK82_02740 [Steroidobacteraceae bacterium]|nr:hypothetical protein [Steroidobacteraceae bacterium]